MVLQKQPVLPCSRHCDIVSKWINISLNVTGGSPNLGKGKLRTLVASTGASHCGAPALGCEFAFAVEPTIAGDSSRLERERCWEGACVQLWDSRHIASQVTTISNSRCCKSADHFLRRPKQMKPFREFFDECTSNKVFVAWEVVASNKGVADKRRLEGGVQRRS